MKENKLLKLSAWGGLFFALLGLGCGIIIKSEMLWFDGLYSLVSLCLSMMAIAMCTFMEKTDKINFPFGKDTISPIIVVIKSIVLIIMCSTSMINSIKTMFSGGNSVNSYVAIGYTIVSIAGCFAIYLYMKNSGKKLNSDILKVESSQWLMDGLISVGVFVGFIIVLLIQETRFSGYSKFIDPAMVIVSSVIFLRVPIGTLISGFRELIQVKASDEIDSHIKNVVSDIEEEYNFEDPITRVCKTGNLLRIEIDFIFGNESKMKNLKEMDIVREKIHKLTKNIKYEKWINVSFTGNKEWVI